MTTLNDKQRQPWSENITTLRLGKFSVPYIYPKWGDARLIQIFALASYAIFGQTIYRFQITPLQILTVVLLSALLDAILFYRAKKIILFPASGLITGLGLSMMLRVEPGFHPFATYVLAAILSVCSKYCIRTKLGGAKKHIFNPSNFGIVCMFLFFPGITYPTPAAWEQSWWLMLFIAAVGVLLTYRAKVLSVVAAFIASEIALFVIHEGVLAQAGLPYLVQDIVPALLAPALVIFTFHMISDPRTMPEKQSMRMIYAMLVAMMHWFLFSMGCSIRSIFYALFIVCLFVPLMNHLARDTTSTVVTTIAKRTKKRVLTKKTRN